MDKAEYSIGDIVEVVDNGYGYPTHPKLDDYNFKNYVLGSDPQNGSTGTICGEPFAQGRVWIYPIDMGNQQYLVDNRGLKLISKMEKKEMKKSDLVNGMVVEGRDGKMYMYLETPFFNGFVCKDGYEDIEEWDEDLVDVDGADEYDIVAVYQPKELYEAKEGNWDDLKPIWERGEDAEELTVAEIEAKLGYKVKIIEG